MREGTGSGPRSRQRRHRGGDGGELAAGDGSISRSLSHRAVELTAERLRVMAERNRIALLEALREGEAGVQELADRVGLPHQNASHHLSILWRAGILTRHREGTVTLYAIEDWSAWWVVEQVAGVLADGDGRRERPAE